MNRDKHTDELLLINETKSNNFEFKRNKQIEEMARDIASTPIGTVKPDLTLTKMGEVYKGEFILRIAKHLYTADYRKSADVAHEILQKLVDKSKVNNYCTAIVTLEDVIKVVSEYIEVENEQR